MEKRLRNRQRLRGPSNFLTIRWGLFLFWIALCHWSEDGGRQSLYPSFFASAADKSSERAGDEQLNEAYSGTRRVNTNIRGSSKAFVSKSDRPTRSINQLLIAAGKRGLGGGIPGAMAGMVQVITLMWLRTIMTYQCRYGTNFSQALNTLLREGGIARLYRGLTFALVQAPLCRFVSTAANDGVNLLLASLESTKEWGPGRKVAVASLVVGIWRMLLMPIDTMKTVLQVDSIVGFRGLLRRVKAGQVHLLYQGAIATYISSVMGHFPWYWTYNTLEASPWLAQVLPWTLIRSGGIGFLASVVSDTVINSARVLKTTKQSLGSKHAVTYGEAIRMVLAADGWQGLFGRGLRTRIMGNALQSIVFTVIWRSLADAGKKKSVNESEASQ